MILHHSEGINLIHHVFLDRELIDNLVFDTGLCHHVVHLKVEIEFLALHVAKHSCGIYNEFVVIGIDMYPTKEHTFLIAIEAAPHIERYREVFQYRGERS